MIIPLYRQVSSEVEERDLVVMGDSAGGGISLALAQLLREMGLKQPGNIILISPLLDMTFSHPMIRMIEKQDMISATPALHDIAKWYAGDESVKHYLVSQSLGTSMTWEGSACISERMISYILMRINLVSSLLGRAFR